MRVSKSIPLLRSLSNFLSLHDKIYFINLNNHPQIKQDKIIKNNYLFKK